MIINLLYNSTLVPMLKILTIRSILVSLNGKINDIIWIICQWKQADKLVLLNSCGGGSVSTEMAYFQLKRVVFSVCKRY